MDFFKSVFSEDQQPSDPSDLRRNDSSESPKQENVQDQSDSSIDSHSDSSIGNTWSFGGLMKTLTTKSESVIQTYKRDLEEFSVGLKNETVAIREVASRAVKEIPVSIEAGASVAQGSLESVWRGTAEIISQGKGVILSADFENASNNFDSNNQERNNNIRNSRTYSSRFEANVYAIQNDMNTYTEELIDLDEFKKWKLGFDLEEKGEEIENLLDENNVMEGIYSKLVPSVIDSETFWSRYYFRVYKLKQVEDARANLVKRAISVDDEEDLSWDVDDDESSNKSESRVDSSVAEDLEKKETKELQSGIAVTENKSVEELQVENSKVADRKSEDKAPAEEVDGKNESEEKMAPGGKVEELESESNDKSGTKSDEKVIVEGKNESGESVKSSELSGISGQVVVSEEEDLGWDEIGDVGSGDEKKATISSSHRDELRKRLSTADEDEDLSWDIEEDEDGSIKH
ncbi:hypothetical protein C5167_020829 [Papaver somniferum]|uniref:BSD domain-containing protein n=1 Tax=Papaver somniferum TaxID=3469 RepID=A0A4Y7IXD1_PAPSO|nr:protein DOS2-like [Papaver somniferum]RZC52401.1 hypothetical protein C5167_020829 [Papaver somniferum]